MNIRNSLSMNCIPLKVLTPMYIRTPYKTVMGMNFRIWASLTDSPVRRKTQIPVTLCSLRISCLEISWCVFNLTELQEIEGFLQVRYTQCPFWVSPQVPGKERWQQHTMEAQGESRHPSWLQQWACPGGILHLSITRGGFSFDYMKKGKKSTFNLCSFLLTMTEVICWSMKRRMVRSMAGMEARR